METGPGKKKISKFTFNSLKLLSNIKDINKNKLIKI